MIPVANLLIFASWGFCFGLMFRKDFFVFFLNRYRWDNAKWPTNWWTPNKLVPVVRELPKQKQYSWPKLTEKDMKKVKQPAGKLIENIKHDRSTDWCDVIGYNLPRISMNPPYCPNRICWPNQDIHDCIFKKKRNMCKTILNILMLHLIAAASPRKTCSSEKTQDFLKTSKFASFFSGSADDHPKSLESTM